MTARTPLALLSICLLTAAAGAQELLRDDFTHGLGQWSVSDPALATVVDGRLRLASNGTISAGDASWRDYEVRFTGRYLVTSKADGLWGVHLRAVPGPAAGELFIFARPERLGLAGSGKTEWAFTGAPPFDATAEHRYRYTVRGGEVEVEVDGRHVGTAHNVGNATGGVRFHAYNCTAEIGEVVITALAPEAALVEPALALDLPAGERPVAVDQLPEHLDFTVCNPTAVRRADAPVVVPLSQLSFAKPPNLSSLTVTDAAGGAALPTQVDDLLGTGRIPASGTPEAAYGPSLCCLVSVEPYAARTLRLRYTTAAGAWRQPSGPVATELAAGQLTVRAPAYTAQLNAKGGLALRPAGSPAPFATARADEGETVICRRMGPVRALVITRRTVKDNGRVTRVTAAWPGQVQITTTLEPDDRRHDAFVGPVGGFFFDLAMPTVTALRYHTVSGFTADPPGDQRPAEKLYAASGEALAVDFDLGGRGVALIRRQQPDYTPGMGVIGWHHYTSGGLAFGWRPPIEVRRGRPHVQQLWLVPHPDGLAAFREADETCRRPVTVATPEVVRPWARQRAEQTRRLAVAARLPGAPEGMAATVAQAATAFTAAQATPAAVAELMTGERRLGELDLAAVAREVVTALAARAGALPADREPAPYLALLGQARSCAAAAAWDFAADHTDRGAARLARAADCYQRAVDYARRAPARIQPATPAVDLHPYVTFSEGANARLARMGFDTGHLWVPWGHHFEQLETERQPGRWNFAIPDRMFADAGAAGMALIPLLDFSPPRWWQKQFEPQRDAPNAPPGSTGDDRLVSPALLGRVPPHMQAFGEYIKQIAGRYAKAGVIAWSVRNEPAYYTRGGLNGPLMREAFDRWIRGRYADIAALNAVWGTRSASFETLDPPRKWDDNQAAWYDLMTFKAECLNGELSWEADLAQQASGLKRSGAKFVAACSGPGAARSGFGVDPWLTAGAQRGVAFCDLYLDDPAEAALRAAELSWGAGGVPVISCETGPNARPAGREFRYHFQPDRRARSYPWMMLQYGLTGTHYWCWATADEYGCLDWDGTLSDYGLEAALANRELQAARPALAGLMPRVDVGLVYPRASFVQGERWVVTAYERAYAELTRAGYQVRLIAPSDFDRAAAAVKHLVLPPAPYVEASLAAGLARYVAAGGTLLVCGQPGGWDEYARPRPGGLTGLGGARVWRLDWSGQPATGAELLPAALARSGAPRSLSAAPAGVYQRLLTGPRGDCYLVVSNLSGAEARWQVALHGVPGTRRQYLDLLSGDPVAASTSGAAPVLSLVAEPDGARLIRVDAEG